LAGRYDDDPISPAFIRSCATNHFGDEQLHFFVTIIEQASELNNEYFRIARLYSALEAMAGAITSQFERGADRPMKRTAIRFMLGYFLELDIPRFTINENADFEFDHIELAGRVRDKIFHGGGILRRGDVPEKLRDGVDLLHVRPDLIAHALRRDCEKEISGWASPQSRAWQAQNGETFELPDHDSNFEGRTFTKRLISSNGPIGSAIGSVDVTVNGLDIGLVRLKITQ